MDQNNTMNVCKCTHHKIMPIAILLIGVTVLLTDFNVFSMNVANIIWPILLIIGAGSKLGGCKCCAK